ncbi:MAG: glycerophosphoryl diester phosphodiesterase membrane domain-containing protein [Kiritimatiellae bacterium]|nr:glycerophosphoryl diester phosphodiesterase membrane domain-containing protein [Kiritimatiellia bacterium]
MKNSPGIVPVLTESLSCFCRVVRSRWLSLLAVFVPCQALVTLLRYALRGVDGARTMQAEGLLSGVLMLTIGVVAVAIAGRCVQRMFFGKDNLEAGGAFATFMRALWTTWMRYFAQFFALLGMGIAVSLLVVIACVLYKVFHPGVEIDRSVVTAAVASSAVATVVLWALWIVVRWLFAVPISIVNGFSGFAALSESAKFTRGRMIRILLFALAAYLVIGGLNFVPCVAGFVMARGVMPGLPPVIDSAPQREAVLFALGIIQQFVMLVYPIACIVYLFRADGHVESDGPRVSVGSRLAIAGLIILGLGTSVSTGIYSFLVQRSLRAADERILKSDKVVDLPAGFRFAESLREENGQFSVDSPFDLRLGSTNYVHQLGERARDGAFISLSKPYFGFDALSLNFKKQDGRLLSVSGGSRSSNSPAMSLQECRTKVDEITADMCSRFGASLEDMSRSDAADYLVRERVKKAKRRDKKLQQTQHLWLCHRELKVRVDGREVSYSISATIDADTEKCDINLTIL